MCGSAAARGHGTAGCAGRCRGVLCERSDDEGPEQQQARIDRLSAILDDDPDRSPAAPALALDRRDLAVAVGERVALAPDAARTQLKPPGAPAQLAAAA